jgi:HEAT repeat protein
MNEGRPLDPADQSGSGTKSEKRERTKDVQKIQTMVGRLIVALRNLHFYPASHPISARLVDLAYDSLIEVLEGRTSIDLTLAGTILMIDGEPLEDSSKKVFSNFMTELPKRRVVGLTFLTGVTREEFIDFLETMDLDPDEAESAGGIAHLVRERGVHHIIVHEIHLGHDARVESEPIEPQPTIPSHTTTTSRGSDAIAEEIMSSAGSPPSGSEQEKHGAWSRRLLAAIEHTAEELVEEFGGRDQKRFLPHMASILLELDSQFLGEFLRTQWSNSVWTDVIRELLERVSDRDLIEILMVGWMEKPTSPSLDEARSLITHLRELFREGLVDGSRKGNLLREVRRCFVAEGLPIDNLASMHIPPVTPTSEHRQAYELLNASLSRIKDVFQETGDVSEIIHRVLSVLDDQNPSERLEIARGLDKVVEELAAISEYDGVDEILMAALDRMRREGELDVYKALAHSVEAATHEVIAHHQLDMAERAIERLADYANSMSDLPQGRYLLSVLGRIQHPESLRALVDALYRPELSLEAAEILVEQGERSVHPLLSALKIIEDREMRMRIIDVIIKIGSPARSEVAKALHDPRWHVRRNACLILSRIGGQEDVVYLAPLLYDSSLPVRTEVVFALGEIGGADAEETLNQALKDKSETVRLKAIDSLVKIKGSKTIELLASVIQRKGVFGIGETDRVRAHACQALGQIGGKGAQQVLSRFTNDRSPVVRRAVEHALRSEQKK